MNENDETPEQKRQVAIELANAYREMMAMFAWRHFKGVVLERIKNDALKAMDNCPIRELTLAEVAETRGIRKALDQIQTEIEWILNGNEAITR